MYADVVPTKKIRSRRGILNFIKFSTGNQRSVFLSPIVCLYFSLFLPAIASLHLVSVPHMSFSICLQVSFYVCLSVFLSALVFLPLYDFGTLSIPACFSVFNACLTVQSRWSSVLVDEKERGRKFYRLPHAGGYTNANAVNMLHTRNN